MKKTILPAYFKILSPEFPAFLTPYLQLPLLKRLEGIGLLCGTDWTRLYHNRFFYSRFDHSVGVALIIWNFTKDKKQTIAGLLHDISTPVFSHVMDFRHNDALHQEYTEQDNARMIAEDKELLQLLKNDQLDMEEVIDYQEYPIADNSLPQLSADRLEYMFMTGLIMEDIWTLEDIAEAYGNMEVMQNESGLPEIGFTDERIAREYCLKCCKTGMIMIKNENKLALSLLAHLSEWALRLGAVQESDFYTKSEQEILNLFSSIQDTHFRRYFMTFREMTAIVRSEHEVADSFCIRVDVKRRYINPLCNGVRISDLSDEAAQTIRSLKEFTDSTFAAVRIC